MSVPERLTSCLHGIASRGGERPALQTAAGNVSYAELMRSAELTAQQLTRMGVRPGDRILLLLPNSIEFVAGVLGAMTLGCTAVLATVGSGPQRLRRIVELTRPRACLVAEGRTEHLPGLQQQVIGMRASGAGELRFTPEAASGGKLEAAEQASDAPALVLFSSGSTGQAKGVVLGHSQVLWTARMLGRVFELDGSHRELLLSSMSHSGAWQRLAATLVAGGSVHLHEGYLSVPGLLSSIEEHQITGFYTPPPLVRYLLQSNREAVRSAFVSCRHIEIGSAALGRAELERMLELLPGVRIVVHYGLTECSRGVILDAGQHPSKLGTVGQAVPGVEIEIRDEAGGRAPLGADGQILLRGPQLADGYWGQPALTSERFAGGWIHTGDQGSLDSEGFLTFRGRKDDMICSAGYSFYPQEVEAELGEVPGVRQYQIAGVPDPRGILGDWPCAFVVPSRAQAWSPAEFLSWARERLPSYMLPRRVIVVPGLPTSASGKPDRRRTVELYARRVAAGGDHP